MCGIVGILDLNRKPVSRDVLQRMNDCIVHRGPDEEGLWLRENIGLAMRRLAIIDLQSGQQPLTNEDETVWIVFNGEIYNFPELRAQLEAKGHRFRTHGDTETIVHAYEEWGEDCPKYLRGMFAFAIYDLKRKVLFVARDRCGKKPLLYTTAGGQFLFASEFRALLSHPAVPRRPHLPALDAYLAMACVPAPLTAYEGIHKLPPAHSLTVRDGEIALRRYWSLEEHFEPSRKLKISAEDAAAEVLQRLEEAVKIRLMSEVPLGAFLSGGIDSSAVVALMSRLSSTPVKTFSIGFEESDFSEVQHARRVAEHYSADHTEIIVRPDAAAILPDLTRHYGEPYADSSAVPTFYVSQATRRHVTVALNGDGGDEVFAGYERYRAMRLTEQLPGVAWRIGGAASHLLPGDTNFRNRGARLKRLLQAAALPAPQRYLRWQSAFNTEQKRRLYTADFAAASDFETTRQPVEKWLAEYSHLDPVDRCLLADTMTYLPDDLLVKVDITSMANSLEARSPFLDHPLLEWAAKLPSNLKLHGKDGKYVLRRALEGLVPAANMERPKMGFGVPVGQWLRGDLKPMLHDLILSERALARGYFRPDAVRHLVAEHIEARADHSARLWALLMLEMWHDEFVD